MRIGIHVGDGDAQDLAIDDNAVANHTPLTRKVTAVWQTVHVVTLLPSEVTPFTTKIRAPRTPPCHFQRRHLVRDA